LQPVIQHVSAAPSVVLQFGATDCRMQEARAFAEGAPCQAHQLNFAHRLAWRAIAARIRKHDLLAEHVHGFRCRASLYYRLLGRLLPWRDWRGMWWLIGGDSRSRCLRNRGRRRTGVIVLGRVDKDDEQKPDSQSDTDHPLASGHIGRTVALSAGRLRCGGCSRGSSARVGGGSGGGGLLGGGANSGAGLLAGRLSSTSETSVERPEKPVTFPFCFSSATARHLHFKAASWCRRLRPCSRCHL
jgi:hypothetical protein